MHEGHRERMRERLFSHDESLTDCEMLEIVLYDFISRKDTNPIAHALLDCFGDLYSVFHATPKLLCVVAGIGPAVAEKIYLHGCLYERIFRDSCPYVRLYNSEEVKRHVKNRLSHCREERLELYMTDSDNNLICTKVFGNLDNFKVELEGKKLSAVFAEVKPANVIIAHNHPSGSEQPSAGDDFAVERIRNVCRLHSVKLCDSIIYTDRKMYSYYLEKRL